jgi:hypothetical protein
VDSDTSVASVTCGPIDILKPEVADGKQKAVMTIIPLALYNPACTA